VAGPGRRSSKEATALVSVAAELGGVRVEKVTTAGAILLQSSQALSPGAQIRSTLNNDGTPLQICVTADRHGRAVRLIGDPGATAPSIDQSLTAGRTALEALFGPTPVGALCSRILALLLPHPLEDYPEAANGILWLATSVTGAGHALYVKARWARPCEDWNRVAAVTRQVMPYPREAEDSIDALRRVARPMSVGLETAGPDQTRVKVYWRLERPVLLKSVGIHLIGDDALGDFLARVVGARTIPRSGLVFSISHSLETGKINDAKVDVCAHCVRQSPREWLDVIEPLARDYALASPGVGPAMEAQRADIAFLGFGVDHRREKRMNLYLKIPDASSFGKLDQAVETEPAAPSPTARVAS
jgi:hypothetical protein